MQALTAQHIQNLGRSINAGEYGEDLEAHYTNEESDVLAIDRTDGHTVMIWFDADPEQPGWIIAFGYNGELDEQYCLDSVETFNSYLGAL